MKKITFLFAVLLLSSLHAEVKFATIFTNHMVLQRNVKLPIHGTAAPNEKITVTFAGQTVTTAADKNGKWCVELAPLAVSKKGLELKAAGAKNNAVIRNVLVGDVWLCGGQSNMEMQMWTQNPRWRATDGLKHVQEGRNDLIRFVKVPKTYSFIPAQTTKPMQWVIANGNNATVLSATAFYFGQELYKSLEVPIGLLVSCWSGSRIEPWISPYGFDSVPQLKNISFAINAKKAGTPEYKATNAKIQKIYEKWLADFKKAAAENKPRPAFPSYPAEAVPYKSVQNPTMAYNCMIYPLLPFAVKGAIWYQGCSNLGEGMNYFYKMQALVNAWRKDFNDANMPFYFVQLAPYTYKNPFALPATWEAQHKFALADKNSAMAVINDIGDFNDIHPHNKKDVGKRLSLLALKYTYGQSSLKADSPELIKHEVKDGKFILKFKNVEKWINKNIDKNFELSSDNKKWHKAKFEIQGTDITVFADTVKNPTHLRYMWHQHPQGNLWNEAGLPLGAFRCKK